MATMFGRFDIQSELSKSSTALIYKAMDLKSNQVVALKTQSLETLGERASAFVEALIAEGESTRDLASQNIVGLYGAGEIDGQFCAAMEYIQGNSIATMLVRNEGFSIWDLLDITRQLCAGLEQAAEKGVTHHSLEPAKIMVQWDGMVKILGYGISNMSLIEAESGKGLGPLMSYCSPEQIRGETIDLRSNLFTLGAILYEMAVGQKAFDGSDPVALISQIENAMPTAPSLVNAKVHPLLSELIMKALAKDPGQRYQNARGLLEDLEKCKETGKKPVVETKKSTPSANVAVSSAARAAAASKFLSPDSSAAKAVSPKPVSSAPVSSTPVSSVSPVPTSSVPARIGAPPLSPPSRPAGETRAAAAAASGRAGAGAQGVFSVTDSGIASNLTDSNAQDSNSGARLISDFEMSAFEPPAARARAASATAAVVESERRSPGVGVDPVMSAPVAGSAGKSFSDLAEMPPLKGPVFVETILEPAEELPEVKQNFARKNLPQEEKSRIQPREVAEKAIHEIATIPPRLMLFSILGAVALILVVSIAVLMHVRSEDEDTTAAPEKIANATSNQPAVQTPTLPQTAPPQARVPQAILPPLEAQPKLTVRAVERRSAKNLRTPVPPPALVVVVGDALIDSTPQGASFQVDGKSDPSWVTPFTVTGLSAGKHIISVNKAGYSADIHSVDVAAGGRSSLGVHLAPLNALVAVSSTPAGAEIMIDGKPTGRVTPAQFAVEKGSHTVLLRKQGYLEETTTAELGPGQNFQFAPTLRALGNAEDMRTVGKLNKLFGHGGDSAAGMGTISVHTQPKGAQVVINQRILDKLSPVDVMLGPGNYIVDITLIGFKPVHKVVTVDKGGKAAIDESLERQ